MYRPYQSSIGLVQTAHIGPPSDWYVPPVLNDILRHDEPWLEIVIFT